MRRELVIFVVLLSIFFAIGCTDTGDKETKTTEEGTPVEKPVTPSEAVTPAEEPQPAGEGKIVEVAIQNFAFEPASVTISTGDTVRWTNMESTAHTVRGPSFESNVLDKGGTYEFLFTKPGIYNYNCSIHPAMEGTVTVEEKK